MAPMPPAVGGAEASPPAQDSGLNLGGAAAHGAAPPAASALARARLYVKPAASARGGGFLGVGQVCAREGVGASALGGAPRRGAAGASERASLRPCPGVAFAASAAWCTFQNFALEPTALAIGHGADSTPPGGATARILAPRAASAPKSAPCAVGPCGLYPFGARPRPAAAPAAARRAGAVVIT